MNSPLVGESQVAGPWAAASPPAASVGVNRSANHSHVKWCGAAIQAAGSGMLEDVADSVVTFPRFSGHSAITQPTKTALCQFAEQTTQRQGLHQTRDDSRRSEAGLGNT